MNLQVLRKVAGEKWKQYCYFATRRMRRPLHLKCHCLTDPVVQTGELAQYLHLIRLDVVWSKLHGFSCLSYKSSHNMHFKRGNFFSLRCLFTVASGLSIFEHILIVLHKKRIALMKLLGISQARRKRNKYIQSSHITS